MTRTYKIPEDLAPGSIFESVQFGFYQVIEYKSNNHIVVKFTDTGYISNPLLAMHVRNGSVKDYNYPTVVNFGYLGSFGGIKNITKTPLYRKWHGMVKRCKNPWFKDVTYEDKDVVDEWASYPEFYAWAIAQKGHDKEGWELDKDFLVDGNKIYGPDTCCFIPKYLNGLFRNTKISEQGLPKGVYRYRGKYIARIWLKDKKVSLGTYESIEEASLAYNSARNEYLRSLAEYYKEDLEDRVYIKLSTYGQFD